MNPAISNSPPISSYILAFLTAFSSLSFISVDDQIAIKVFISSVIHCWMDFVCMFLPFSLIIFVDGGKKMAVQQGRTRRHRFLFLAQHKVGAELETFFLEPEPGLFVWKTEELVWELEPAQNQHRPGFGGKGVLAVLGVTSYKVTDYSKDTTTLHSKYW